MLEKLRLSPDHAARIEETRKIPCELAAEMGVVSRGPHIAFEFRKDGVCKYLQVKREGKDDQGNRTKTFHIEPKGVSLFWWNDDCLNDQSSSAILIITEGVEDALSWLAAGASHVVSVPNGTPDRPSEGEIYTDEDHRFAYLWIDGKLDPRIARFKQIVLSTDNDKAGRVLRDELAIRLGRSRCWFLEYPVGCKDANDVLVKHNGDVLMDVLADAMPVVPSTLVKLSGIPEVKRPVFSTGWPHVDPFLKVTAPELMIITGAPGSGKSQWALALGAQLAWWQKMPGAVLQFEDDVERNRRDLIRFGQCRLGHEFHDEDGRKEAVAWVDRMFRTIAPPEYAEDDAADPDQNLDWLKQLVTEAVTRHGCKWVLIDPWNEVEHMFGRGETEAIYLNRALRQLKRLARRLQIILMIVVHPDKSGGQKHIDELSLYDINGGAVWKNKADHGVVCWRETPTAATTFVKIDKSKNHTRLGVPGIFKMHFDPELATYAWAGVYTKAN